MESAQRRCKNVRGEPVGCGKATPRLLERWRQAISAVTDQFADRC